jgi:hypothetical protein
MGPNLIFVPFAGTMLLTLVVWVVMYYRRITEIQSRGLTVKTRADLDLLSPAAVNSSNNLQNLFELPVTFYALVLALHATNQVDWIHIICAFAFLAFRVVHSAIHCTYNDIMQRFSVYVVSSIFLWVMVVRFALAIVT